MFNVLVTKNLKDDSNGIVDQIIMDMIGNGVNADDFIMHVLLKVVIVLLVNHGVEFDIKLS